VTKTSEATARTKEIPNKILTVVEGIHNITTKNSMKYPADKLEGGAPSWTEPYNKPVLKNHDDYTDPLGRVVAQKFTKSQINTELWTIRMALEITDPDTIERVLDGRYKTLSIGGSTDSAVCSICSKDIIQDGFCGHWKGRTYEVEGRGKVKAFWTAGNLEFDEISFVNMPADTNAQIIIPDASKKRGEGTKESVEGRSESVENILDDLDRLADSSNPAPVIPEVPVQENAGDPPAADPAQVPVVENVKTLEELTAEVKTLTDRAEAAEGKVTELEGEKKSLSEKVTELEAKVTEAESERDKNFKQSVDYATFARRAMAEHVVDMRVFLNKEKAEERDTLITEYAKSSVKVLQKQAEELRAEKPVRETAKTITNPGLAGGPEDIDESTVPTAGEKKSDIKEFESVLLRTLNK
jgi:hypothetical protein